MTAWLSYAKRPRFLGALALLAGSVGLIRATRPLVADSYAQVKRGAAIYAMPQREQLLVFSLGYRAALADLLFGKTMVAAGVHFVERRVFHHLDAYLKGILTLDPRYRDVYRYADTLLNLSTVELPQENLRIARDILEQGLREFPGDAELWMNTGLFVAYLAPQRLPESEDKAEWRAAGAKMIGKACDLWPAGQNVPGTCVASTRLLQEAGKTDAAIASLERLLAVTDDPRARAQAMAKLEELLGQRLARKRQRAVEELSLKHAQDLPSVSRTRYQVLGPKTDARSCAGLRTTPERPECASSFSQLSEIRAREEP